MTVKKNHKKNSKAKLISFAILVLLVIAIGLSMYQSFKIDLMMKDLHDLTERRKQLMSDTQQLQSEVNKLTNIDRIQRMALRNGMIRNTDDRKVLLFKENERWDKLAETFDDKKKRAKSYDFAGVR
ncbi:MAG: hypothetical protein GF313_15570 [Caldithrix sp.]|nr:hypothetical protein [Caldithrix sp.]